MTHPKQKDYLECSIKRVIYIDWCHFCKWLYSEIKEAEERERHLEKMDREFSHDERDGGGD